MLLTGRDTEAAIKALNLLPAPDFPLIVIISVGSEMFGWSGGRGVGGAWEGNKEVGGGGEGGFMSTNYTTLPRRSIMMALSCVILEGNAPKSHGTFPLVTKMTQSTGKINGKSMENQWPIHF